MPRCPAYSVGTTAIAYTHPVFRKQEAGSPPRLNDMEARTTEETFMFRVAQRVPDQEMQEPPSRLLA
jgi:hypothetical protein